MAEPAQVLDQAAIGGGVAIAPRGRDRQAEEDDAQPGHAAPGVTAAEHALDQLRALRG